MYPQKKVIFGPFIDKFIFPLVVSSTSFANGLFILVTKVFIYYTSAKACIDNNDSLVFVI